jgi:hypothetical protein
VVKDSEWFTKRGVGHDLSAAIREGMVFVRNEEMSMWRSQRRCVGRCVGINTRLRRGRHAQFERRDATGALIMLGIFETAQIAHHGLGKAGELSEAAVLALVAGRLKYDRRGEDTIKVNSTCSLDITY